MMLADIFVILASSDVQMVYQCTLKHFT